MDKDRTPADMGIFGCSPPLPVKRPPHQGLWTQAAEGVRTLPLLTLAHLPIGPAAVEPAQICHTDPPAYPLVIIAALAQRCHVGCNDAFA